MSASKELEEGARGMLLLADGLFRLDVCPHGDTLRTVVRNLSPGRLEFIERTSGGPTIIQAAETRVLQGLHPSRFDLEFVLGEGDDAVRVAVTVGALQNPERGTTRLTAQAFLRQAGS